MPLTAKEFDEISAVVKEDKTFTVKELLKLIAKYKEANPSKHIFERGDKTGSHIHVIKANPIPENETPLQKKERERGFKIRTQGESQQADDALKNFKPKKI